MKRKRSVEPSTIERPRTSSTAERHVVQYFRRFRQANDQHGTNGLGGGKQTAPDCQIMTDLLDAVSAAVPTAKISEAEIRQACVALRTFIVAYGVPRTFPGLSAETVLRLAPVASHLRSRQDSLGSGDFDAADEVEALAAACKAAGFTYARSFASKAWCMLGIAVPIYSSEGVAYLKHAGHSLGTHSSYSDYLGAWQAEYHKERPAYMRAAEVHLSATDPLERRCTAEWFAMRGFDVKLMAVGGPMR